MMKRKFDVGECSDDAIQHRSNEGVGDDPILEPKHKIFLSHSGVQKEFVEHLCKALEERCHYPFYDRRPTSLPKGKEFPHLIKKATQQCQLFVVVVSDEYFMSKWPMIELNAFVQATKVLELNTDKAILPLFYGLSVSDLKDEKRQQGWLEKWKTFAKANQDGGQIKVEDWSFAVDKLTKYNGLSYNQELKEIVAYENEIVSHICILVSPDIKWHDSHVQGNVHKVLLDKMKPIGLSQKYNVKVVGIYGVGGIGKTTTCKTLCNELLNEYEGRVCHLEFNNTCSNSKELLQHAVIKLTKRSTDFACQYNEGECEDILHKNLGKHRTFLAIDNVWDNANSTKQARRFLEIPSHRDSLVVVTARSSSILALLGIDGDACLEMPELEEVDATSLFLYYAGLGEQFTTREDMNSIKLCVEKCYFGKGDGRSYHYHPLALEALGRQLYGFQGKPSEWVRLLCGVWNSSSSSGETFVFGVLRSSFDLLEATEQALFMDIGLFLCGSDFWLAKPLINWKEELCDLYKKDEAKIQSQLNSLKQKGLLQDADLTLGRISMHDLYYEFARSQVFVKFGATTDIGDRRWMLIDGDDADLSELDVTPVGGCWQKLSRLCIQEKVEGIWDHLLPNYRPLAKPITSLEGIKWKYFANVWILQLTGLQFFDGSLNLKDMTCLRRLQLHDLRHLKSLEGLESLKNLTYFDWNISSYNDIKMKTNVVGQFPTSLRYLFMRRQCVLSGPNVFLRCINLIKLKLLDVEVGVSLDLSKCSLLEAVTIFIAKANFSFGNTLPIHISSGSSRLHTLRMYSPYRILIPRLNQLHGLVQLDMKHLHWVEVPSLLSLTKLEVLKIGTHAKPAEHIIPHQLQELFYHRWEQHKAPCLNAFKQLQVLDFSSSFILVEMYGMGELPALQSLNLNSCTALKRLPNLSKSRCLEVLKLDGCKELELYKEDFAMLATLPLLHPVSFSSNSEHYSIRLDIIGKKVLRYLGPSHSGPHSWLAWKEGDLEDLELGQPPIKFGNRGIWDTCIDSNFIT